MKRLFKNIRIKKLKLSDSTVFYCALALVIILAAVVLIRSRVEISRERAEYNRVRQQCEEQQAANDELRNLLNNNDDEYIELRAREDLDYVLPGERVYIVRYGN